ncbi:MAG: Cys-Gln thioester bond-forming surface protein [Chthonomonadales bacterium]|nr:Cys-Gln thioester bond-forming surface protein [Chthonomonadales bacterium]
MRTILRGSCALFAVALLGLSTRSLAYNRIEKPLYAGQHILIGKLVVEQIKKTESNRTVKYLRVTYDTTGSDWVMTTTHLYVSKNKPTRAAPGRFPFKHEGLDNVKVDVYEIPLSTLLCSDQELYIAAHADVCELVADPTSCTPDFAKLNDQVAAANGTVVFSYGDPAATFNVDLGDFGIYPGYCVDFGGTFPDIDSVYGGDPGDYLTWVSPQYANALEASYDATGALNSAAIALLPPFASNPNLDLINYLINQTYIAGSNPLILPSAIQLAIWHFSDGIDPATLLGTGYPELTNLAYAIIADAEANGEGFVPTCGQNVMVIANPTLGSTGQHYQHIGFITTVEGSPTTGDCETAWAKGTTRFCTGWGSYFKYTVK